MNLKLISNLNFAEKLNANNPVTESGKEMLKNYKGYLFQNDVTYGLVNGFIKEASKFTFDTGMMSILESVLKYVNENRISWKLATACESINNNGAQYNYIARMSLPQVEKLLEMKESEVVQYIKAGALKNIQYIPEFRSICKEVYKSNVVEETYTPSYNLVNPVSYITVSESGTLFSIFGKTFKFTEDEIQEATSEDATFNMINALLPNFKRVDETLEYTYNASIVGKPYHFVISENEVKFDKGTIEKTFESGSQLREFADQFSRTLAGNEKMAFLNIATNIATVFENIGNICEVDRAKILETANNDLIAIIEANNNVNMTVFKSANCGQSSTSYKYMSEALNDIKKITGINLATVYENRLNEDVKKQDPDSAESIKEQLEVVKSEKIDARRKKIEMLAEQFKNDPVKIALLNIASKELAILEN